MDADEQLRPGREATQAQDDGWAPKMSRKELLLMGAGGTAALAGGGVIPLGRQTARAANTNGPSVVIEWNNAAL